MQSVARLRYMKGSAQKVRLVADLIRGKKVNDAAAILRATSKYASRDLLRLLKSAIANAEQNESGVDVDALFISRILVDGGPREKRIRPAPMGRAYRVQKRKSHVMIEVSDQARK